MQLVIVRKVILLYALIVSSFILSACAPIVQSASAVGTVATMSDDRRSAGEILDDKALNYKLSSVVRKDTILDDMHINFMVYNKAVLMAGEPPSIEARESTSKKKSRKSHQK